MTSINDYIVKHKWLIIKSTKMEGISVSPGSWFSLTDLKTDLELHCCKHSFSYCEDT